MEKNREVISYVGTVIWSSWCDEGHFRSGGNDMWAKTTLELRSYNKHLLHDSIQMEQGGPQRPTTTSWQDNIRRQRLTINNDLLDALRWQSNLHNTRVVEQMPRSINRIVNSVEQHTLSNFDIPIQTDSLPLSPYIIWFHFIPSIYLFWNRSLVSD